MSLLVDSHCHLNYPPMAQDRAGVVVRAKAAGVGTLLTISTTMREWHEVRADAEAFESVWCSVGIHPNHVHETGEQLTTQQIIELTQHPKVVGIGETGLDTFHKDAPLSAQEQSFREHIRASNATGLPLIIHSREAEADTARILREEGTEQGVMHCFSSGRSLMEDALALGFYISFSGMITFKKNEALRAMARDVPLNRLLVETDSPYLAPEPMRGKPCEPAYVAHTARRLAEIKGISFDELATQTTQNFFALFKKAQAA
jgi:TatD DNase family protein